MVMYLHAPHTQNYTHKLTHPIHLTYKSPTQLIIHVQKANRNFLGYKRDFEGILLNGDTETFSTPRVYKKVMHTIASIKGLPRSIFLS